jgi:hypothetical protein
MRSLLRQLCLFIMPLSVLSACSEDDTVLRIVRDAGADVVQAADAGFAADTVAPDVAPNSDVQVDSVGVPDDVEVDAAEVAAGDDAADGQAATDDGGAEDVAPADVGPVDAGPADVGPDVPQPACVEGDKCDDGDACTSGDTCTAGACAGGPAISCDDGNPCTDDNCDGQTGCVHLANAATCDDANACTAADTCGAQGCKGKPVDCDDGNACTDDLCDPKKGCSSAPNSAPCSDGNDCTLGDACAGGGCVGGKAKPCSDDNPCTADACNAIGGACAHTATEAACNDGSACTSNDACAAGTCAGKPLSCDDGDPCTLDSCDAKTGCDYELSKGPCNDGNACTDFDKCLSGKCKGVAKDASDCDDGNACTDDSCDKAIGCVNTANSAPCNDGNNCTQGDTCAGGKCGAGINLCDCEADADCKSKEDGDLCNGTLFCDKSKAPFVCAINPKTVVTCSTANDSACSKTSCDKATGQCAPKAVNEGNPCDADGSACTPDDACAKGACQPGALLGCDDKNPCTTDSCDPLSGCKHIANSAPCDADGNACTVADSCQDKVCVVGKAKSCEDQNSCTKDACDAKSGQCQNDGAPLDGQGCDADGSVCTPGDACQAGSCVAGKALGCDDKNPCTVDSCDGKAGCVNAATTGACDADGDACTVGDACQSKVCVAGQKKSCDDGDACTTDACDIKTGACSHTAVVGCGGNCQNGGDCDDKNVCTGDSCAAGKCVHLALDGTPCDDGTACTTGDACAKSKCVGALLTCDDKNACTDDSCDASSGCLNLNNAAACDDKDACTVGDACSAGSCVPGKVKVCDDGDKCTADACQGGNCVFTGIPGCGGYCANASDCDDKNGCTTDACNGGKCAYGNTTAACDDGNACTVGETCAGGKCQGGTAKSCDDGNACTTDSCDPKSAGCQNLPAQQGLGCDDKNGCTSNDACDGKGACAGVAKNCDDGNVCTTDSCNAQAQCVYVNNAAACDDGDACTFGESCLSGKCLTINVVWADTAAGSTAGYADGTGGAAKFNYPYGVAADASGNMFVADSSNHVIRKITPTGVTTTFAGSGKLGWYDAQGTQAWFNSPFGVAIDAAGNLFVADTNNHLIRKISAVGEVSTVAGTSAAGAADGPAGQATFNKPYAVAVSPGGALFVADTGNNRIRVIANGVVSTLAGNTAGFADGQGKAALFNGPIGLAADGKGNVLVADQTNHRIRRVTATGVVTTFAGSGIAGLLDGGAAGARFQFPWGIAIAGDGTVYVGDRYNHRIRKIANGLVTTYAGTGVVGTGNGAAGQATFHYPAGVAVDPSGYVYVADGHNHRIRRVRDGVSYCSVGNTCYVAGLPNPQNSCQTCQPATAAGQWTTALDGAPCTDGNACTSGDGCASGQCAGKPTGCDDKDACTKDACDGGTGLCVFAPIVGCGGNCALVSDCDDDNPCTTDGCVAGKCANAINTAACDDGNACTLGDICVNGSCVAGSNVEVSTYHGTTQGFKEGAPTLAQWNRPGGLDVDAAGTLYVADWYNHVVRKIAADGTSSIVAGTGVAGYADGPGKLAQFNIPTDVKLGPGGLLYVTDFNNARIRVIAVDGTVSTIAGVGGGYQDGPAAQARFNAPYCLAVTAGGAVLVADYNNHRIRRIAGGVVSTLAGGVAGFADGTGAAAKFNGPLGIGVDSQGNAYVADQLNHRIRKVTPGGVVATLAGNGKAGYADGDVATAQFNVPWGVTVDAAGHVLVVDRGNQRIRRITPAGVVSKVAGSGAVGAVNGVAAAATFANPIGIAVDQRGQLFVGDFDNFRVRRIVDGSKPCQINAVCYAGGTLKPGDACQECDASKSATDFSARPDGAACTDGKLCTSGDQCAAGNCQVAAVSCDDKNDCTADSCNTATGACVFDPIIGCNGYCTQSSQCDDKNVCTTDACTNNACVFANNTAACDDGNPCTDGDACAGGVCQPGMDTTVATLAGGAAGYVDAKGAAAAFNQPIGAEVMPDGTVYVADAANHRIRRIATDGTVSTFAGSGNPGLFDATGANAWFNAPADLASDGKGDLYVADRDNAAIRKIDAKGVATTLAGGVAGLVDATGKSARFNQPYSVAVTPAGVVYVADYGNHRIRKVTPQGVVTTFAGSTAGYKDGKGAGAQFNNPIGVALDGQGNVWVSDYSNHRIRKVSPDGVVSTVAGSGIAGYLDGDPALARFNYPWGIAVDSAGRVLIADRYNHRIRKLAGGLVTTVAGNGSNAWLDGAGTKTAFNAPCNVALAANGTLVVADWGNQRIRRLRDTGKACSIANVCYGAQLSNPTDGCQVCDASKATTTWTVKADTLTCTDGDYCTAVETCTAGKCSGGPSCDDGNACTADSCDAGTGTCTYTVVPNCP